MTKQEIIMIKKYCESQKLKGYIPNDDFFKLGYNDAMDDVIDFLKELE